MSGRTGSGSSLPSQRPLSSGSRRRIWRMVSSNLLRLRLLPRAIPRPAVTAVAGEWILILALIAVGLLAHGFNMFNFPSFTYNGDEGIYSGQALAVLRNSK